MGAKGASAKQVKVEEGAAPVEDEAERERGTIKASHLLALLEGFPLTCVSRKALEHGERLRIHWSR